MTDERQVSDPAPAIRFRPRVRCVVHLPGGRSPESLRPAGHLTGWGLRLLRSAPAEGGTPIDLTLRHADGGGQLVRAKVAGCLPAFGTWHVLDLRLDEAVMPLDWVDPFVWQVWRGPRAGEAARVGRHPCDPAAVLRVRPRAVAAMLVARPNAALACPADEPDPPAGVDVLADLGRLPTLLLRDLLGDETRDRAARRLLVATASDDWPQVCSITRALRGYALGHDDADLLAASREVLGVFESAQPELQRQIVLAQLIETLLAA